MSTDDKKIVRSKSTPNGLSTINTDPNALTSHKRNDSFSNFKENLEALANVAGLQNLPKPPPKVVSIWKAFRDFAFQGSVIDLAVGIIVGGAFGKIVNSLVNDIIMPPIGWLLSGVDFANIYILLKRGKKNKLTHGTYKSLNHAKEDGAVTVNIGVFLNSVLNFVVISMIIFTFVRTIDQLKRKQIATTKKCRFCFSKIDHRAFRCPCCTSEIEQPSSEDFNENYSGHDEDDEDDEEDGGKPQSRGKGKGKSKESTKVLKKNLKRQLSKIDFATF